MSGKSVTEILGGEVVLAALRSDIRMRLRQARIAAGFKSAMKAAEHMGMHYQTYAGAENGHSASESGGGLTIQAAMLYAKTYRVSLDWLITGEGQSGQDPSIELYNRIMARAA